MKWDLSGVDVFQGERSTETRTSAAVERRRRLWLAFLIVVLALASFALGLSIGFAAGLAS